MLNSTVLFNLVEVIPIHLLKLKQLQGGTDLLLDSIEINVTVLFWKKSLALEHSRRAKQIISNS